MASKDNVVQVPSLFAQTRTRLALSPLVVKTYQTIIPYIEKWSQRHANESLFHAPNFMLPNFDGRKIATIHDLSTLRFHSIILKHGLILLIMRWNMLIILSLTLILLSQNWLIC